MSCKGKWRKKSDASSVRTSRTSPWSVETAANYFASIVKSRFAVARMMNYTSWISMSLKSKLKWHPCNPMRERATSLRSRKESLCPQNWPKVKCAAPTVESRVNSCREWIQCFKTVSTSANFHTDASRTGSKIRMAKSYGKLWRSYKSMLCTTALNLDAISAIMKTSSTWLELSYSSTLRENAQK